MPLFEVAIIEKPTKKLADDGHRENLILAPTAVIATNRDGAIVAAMAEAKMDAGVDRSRLEVLVRPFV